MKTKIKIIPITWDKYKEFTKLAYKNGYFNGGRYGWGMSDKEKNIAERIKDDNDIVLLKIPEKEIPKYEAVNPYVVISDKFKYITTVYTLKSGFWKEFLPQIEIEE